MDAVEIRLVLLVIFVVIFFPIGVIWALNVLFGLTIPITLKTWAAILILILIVHGD